MSMLLTEPTLVVEQKRKFFELNNEYAIRDANGTRVGALAQVRQSPLAVITRIFSDWDVALPVTLELRDAGGAALVELHKPWFRMRIGVRRSDGVELGSIAKRVRLGKARFTLRDPAGQDIGEVRAQNWRAKDFTVVDTSGTELARVTKKWRGLLTEAFTDADTYVVQVAPHAVEPLRQLDERRRRPRA